MADGKGRGGPYGRRGDPLRSREERLRVPLDVLESISQSVLFYDEEERLQLFNRHFLESYPQMAGFIRHGRSLVEMTREMVRTGAFGSSPDDATELEAVVRQRLQRLRRAEATPEQRILPDGRHRQIEVRRLPGGGLLIIGTDITEAVARSQHLQETEARLREVFATSLAGLALCRCDGRILEANEALATLFDCTPGSCRGANLHALLGSAGSVSRAFFSALANGKQAAPVEFELTRGGSSWRWCRLRGHRYNRSGDEFLWLIIEDRTAERRAAFLEGRFEEAQRVAHIGSWEWNIVAGTNWWSSGIFDIYNLNKDAFVPTYPALKEFLHLDDRPAFEAAVAAAFEGDGSFETVHRVVWPSGEVRVVHGVGMLIRDDAGQPTKMTGTAQDVTERQAIESASRSRERLLSLITENLPAMVCYIDRARHFRFANAASVRWHAHPKEAIVGHHVSDVIEPGLAGAALPLIEQALAGSAVREELTLEASDGQTRSLDIMMVPDWSDDEEVRGCIVLANDITERKRTEEQLRQAQKMEAVGQLAGGIAHDFNNLLGVIVGNLDLLAQELPDASKAARLLQRAVGAAERGAGLTERLLGYSRRQILQPRRIAVNDVVRETAALLERTLGPAIRLQLKFADDLPCCSVDAGQLESALLNLALNARDAMPDGGHLEIATDLGPGPDDEWECEPGPFVRIVVADTGCGMAPEILARVAEPFFTTKGGGKGSGLGIPMVYGFIEQSGGHLHIDSLPGQGTTIALCLPTMEEEGVD